MRRTLGYHLVKTAYGLWLPGDDRGSWSERWDEEIGYVQPHTLHAGDPVRLRMARERMKHPAVRFTPAMIRAVVEAVGECAAVSDWQVAAASVEATHMHLLLTYSGRDIDRTAKWIAQRATKTVHRRTEHTGPVWAKGRWRSFVLDVEYWRNVMAYVERHNVRRGLAARPYEFVTPIADPAVGA